MKLILTKLELLNLDDRLTLAESGNEELDLGGEKDVTVLSSDDFTIRNVAAFADAPSKKPFLLKIGRAIVDGQDKTSIEFNEEELWLIRELAQSFVSVGPEVIGLELKKKVYKALLSIDAGTDNIKEEGAEEPTYREQLDALETVDEDEQDDDDTYKNSYENESGY
jgi:hypothetical protein